ncbi:hypothetical protein BDN72DRAFT_862142 [Pluteus cervinus]|uniref:Uncharacterized protein n=1 Tax=Pluteus cervinus TaxID=181527 RepID=A0ACD3ACK4_9AGAR|nr:hypothetical protein BDN72DRAFT_862142 [Pluteus cervinus]
MNSSPLRIPCSTTYVATVADALYVGWAVQHVLIRLDEHTATSYTGSGFDVKSGDVFVCNSATVSFETSSKLLTRDVGLAITVNVDDTNLLVISYYNLDDVGRGLLQPISSIHDALLGDLFAVPAVNELREHASVGIESITKILKIWAATRDPPYQAQRRLVTRNIPCSTSRDADELTQIHETLEHGLV